MRCTWREGRVRRVEDITKALWARWVSPSTVSNLNKKIYASNRGVVDEADRGRASLPLSRRHHVEGAGRVTEERVAAGSGVGQRQRYRQILGIRE